MLYPRHYVQFLDGRRGKAAVIARLPGEIAARLPAQTLDVQIGQDYALKLIRKHNLNYADLAMVQPAIDLGWCTRTRPAMLDFLYVTQEPFPRRFILGVKVARGGMEVWLQTFYRCTESDIRRRLRRAQEANALFRTHAW
ncbi:MAG: hypothetical protein KGL12_03960 [Rhodospirillales bacterium]|nr:hypothetical protein [Rhodospirillales bacterium]